MKKEFFLKYLKHFAYLPKLTLKGLNKSNPKKSILVVTVPAPLVMREHKQESQEPPSLSQIDFNFIFNSMFALSSY